MDDNGGGRGDGAAAMERAPPVRSRPSRDCRVDRAVDGMDPGDSGSTVRHSVGVLWLHVCFDRSAETMQTPPSPASRFSPSSWSSCSLSGTSCTLVSDY